MPDLSTTYLGLKLRNPIVASSSSLTGGVERIKKLEGAGVAAVVLKSLFEEQLLLDEQRIEQTLERTTDVHPESLTFYENIPYDTGPEQYLKLVEDARKAVSIPVIASLNCVTAGTWADYARRIEGAGASALELNLYAVQTDPARHADQIEREYLDVVSEVRAATTLPLNVKLGSFLTSVPNFVGALAARGVNGVSLFNRFYQPDLDLEGLESKMRLTLSRPEDALVPLRWVGLIYGRVPGIQLAATSGIHDGRTALKMIAAGAQVVMVCSALYRHGVGHVETMLREMDEWLAQKEYAGVDELRGVLSMKTSPHLQAFERAQYIKQLAGYE
jgi:dihydroorotate dehydrogenase (fumarate)